jgi:hypothetical protein
MKIKEFFENIIFIFYLIIFFYFMYKIINIWTETDSLYIEREIKILKNKIKENKKYIEGFEFLENLNKIIKYEIDNFITPFEKTRYDMKGIPLIPNNFYLWNQFEPYNVVRRDKKAIVVGKKI